MKMRFLTFAVIALLAALVCVSPAKAQNGAFTPYVDASITGTGGGTVGFSNPNFRIGGGIESSTTHLLLDVNAQFDSANLSGFGGLVNSNGGYTGTVTGSGYYKFHGFLLGGGAFYSNQIATGGTVGSFFTGISANRNQIRPFVGGGYQFSRDRILVDYVLPGRDNIAQLGDVNLKDRTVQIRNEFFLGKSGLSKHIRITQNLDINSNLLVGAGTRETNYTAGAGVKFVF